MDCNNCTDVSGYYLGMTCQFCNRPFRSVNKNMKTIKKVNITHKFVVFLPELQHMDESVLYVSLRYKTIGHRCLCGCGSLTITPINENGWILYVNHSDNKISLTPSIGNYNFDCQSHYIITNSVANFV